MTGRNDLMRAEHMCGFGGNIDLLPPNRCAGRRANDPGTDRNLNRRSR